MLAKNGVGLATAETANEAPKTVTGKSDGQFSKPSNKPPQAIPSELIGADRCTAAGVAAGL